MGTGLMARRSLIARPLSLTQTKPFGWICEELSQSLCLYCCSHTMIWCTFVNIAHYSLVVHGLSPSTYACNVLFTVCLS